MREATKIILFSIFFSALLSAQKSHLALRNYPYDPVLQALEEDNPPNEPSELNTSNRKKEEIQNNIEMPKQKHKTPEAGRIDPRRYLSLKKIVFPMPQDYAQAYLKLKTLDNPIHKIVRVHIDKSRQRMWVYVDNEYFGDWKVSTARRGYWTPNGTYRPYTLERMHYSKKYHNSPMPWSVFFKGGYAIHGTYSIRHLGHPASHGCVRVHPRNAKKLYQLIRRYGKQNTRIIIRG